MKIEFDKGEAEKLFRTALGPILPDNYEVTEVEIKYGGRVEIIAEPRIAIEPASIPVPLEVPS